MINSPFKFLSAYNANDVEHFYGRDEEIDALYKLLFKTNLLLVYGLSGTGKTSVIQCGLASRFDDSEWYPFMVRRLNNINDSLNKSLDSALEGISFDNIPDKLKYINEQYYRPVYLIFDQFEELFILGSKEEQLKCIATIKSILDANLQCKIILIMREEYIGQIYPYESMVPALFKHRFRIEALGPAKVKDVIEKSFKSFNVELEVPVEKSLDLILEKLTDENNRIALPYLQVYMDILYRSEYKKHVGEEMSSEKYPILPVTIEDIEEMGMIDNVLDQFIEEQQTQLYKRLKGKYPTLKEEIIPEILDVFITDEGTKRPIQIERTGKEFTIPESEGIALPKIEPKIIQEIVESLEGSRILRIEDDSVELAHDSLALLLEQRRSDDQKLLAQTRKRILNSYQEFEDSGTYLNQKKLSTVTHLIPSLNLPEEVELFIENSEAHAKHVANEEFELRQQALEAEQQKKEARLTKAKLQAEQKAKSRLTVGLIAVGLMLPIIGYMAWSLSQSNAKIKAESDKVLVERDKVTAEKVKLEKAYNELVRVKIVLDTLANYGLVDSNLIALAAQAVTKIDKVTNEENIAAPEYTEVNTIKSFLNSSKATLDEYRVGNIVGFMAFLNLPNDTEVITYRWKDPAGKIIRTKEKAMGRNTSNMGAKLFDYKGLNSAGDFTVEILDGNKKVIKTLVIKVK